MPACLFKLFKVVSAFCLTLVFIACVLDEREDLGMLSLIKRALYHAEKNANIQSIASLHVIQHTTVWISTFALSLSNSRLWILPITTATTTTHTNLAKAAKQKSIRANNQHTRTKLRFKNWRIFHIRKSPRLPCVVVQRNVNIFDWSISAK